MAARVVPKNDQERYWFQQSDIQEIIGMVENMEDRLDDMDAKADKRDASHQFQITTRWVVTSIAVSALIHFLPTFH